MGREPQPELTSWKEIADRLQVTVRTAQEWEKKRGLPVRRLPGGGRSRVYLRESDLRAWLDGQVVEMSGNGDARASGGSTERRGGAAGRRIRRVAIALVGISALAAAVGYLARSAPQPADYRVVSDAVIIVDEDGEEIWRAAFPEGLRVTSYEFRPDGARFTDVDGDGSLETLFVLLPAGKTEPDSLICFDDDGKELWRFTPGRELSTAKEAFENIYRIGAFRFIEVGDGTPAVVLTAIHHLYYPTQVAVLSAKDGSLRSEYWHAGHIGVTDLQLATADVDADGRSEVYLAGVNNARNRATLVVLDPETMAGASVEENPDYQLLGLPEPREIVRVLFRRSAVSESQRYNVAKDIWISDRFITVGVVENVHDSRSPAVLYHVRPDFTVDHIAFGSSFPAAHRQLVEEGATSLTLEEQERLLWTIDYVGRPHPLVPAR